MSADTYQETDSWYRNPYGRVGRMVGRFCDPSYNDIELLTDGERRWFRYGEVEFLERLPRGVLPAALTEGGEG